MALVTLYRIEHPEHGRSIFQHRPNNDEICKWYPTYLDYMVNAVETKAGKPLDYNYSRMSFDDYVRDQFQYYFPGPMDDYVIQGGKTGLLAMILKEHHNFACFSKENFLQWFPEESLIVFVEDFNFRVKEIIVDESNVYYTRNQVVYSKPISKTDITAEFLKGL